MIGRHREVRRESRPPVVVGDQNFEHVGDPVVTTKVRCEAG